MLIVEDIWDTLQFVRDATGAVSLTVYTIFNFLAASGFVTPLIGLIYELILLAARIISLLRYPVVSVPLFSIALHRIIGLANIYEGATFAFTWLLFHWQPDLVLAWHLYKYLFLVLRWVYLLVQVYAINSHQVSGSGEGNVTALVSINARPNGQLDECIRSLLHQCTQIIVLSDDSDILNPNVERWTGQGVQFLRVQSTAPHIRLCVGIQAVTTPYLLLVSPPCSFPPQAIELLLGPMRDTRIGAVATGQRTTPFTYRMPQHQPERPSSRGRLTRTIPDGLQTREDITEYSADTTIVNEGAWSMYRHGGSTRAVYHGSGSTRAGDMRSELGDEPDEVSENSWSQIRAYLSGLARAGSYLGFGSTVLTPRLPPRPRLARTLEPRTRKVRLPQASIRAAQREILHGHLDSRLLNFTKSKVKPFRGAPYYGPPPRSTKRFIF